MHRTRARKEGALKNGQANLQSKLRNARPKVHSYEGGVLCVKLCESGLAVGNVRLSSPSIIGKGKFDVKYQRAGFQRDSRISAARARTVPA